MNNTRKWQTKVVDSIRKSVTVFYSLITTGIYFEQILFVPHTGLNIMVQWQMNNILFLGNRLRFYRLTMIRRRVYYISLY